MAQKRLEKPRNHRKTSNGAFRRPQGDLLRVRPRAVGLGVDRASAPRAAPQQWRDRGREGAARGRGSDLFGGSEPQKTCHI